MTDNQIKAKRFFLHVANLPIEIDNKILEIEVMRTKAEGLGAIRYDKDRVQTSPQDSMPDAIIRMMEFIDKLDDDYKRLVNDRMRADELMEYIEDEQRDVIEMYFFQHKSFFQISNIMNYSEATIKRRYYDALETIGEQMEE